MTAATPGRDDPRRVERHLDGDRHVDGRLVEGGPASPDPLVAARIELEDVGRLPLGDRAEVFERVHGVVVDELRQLEHG